MAIERVELNPVDRVVASSGSSADLAGRCLDDRAARHLRAVERLVECRRSIVAAAGLVAETLAGGGTVFTLGNGGSAAEAQHFAAELVGRFRRDRRALPAMALTTDSSILTAVGNDFCFADVFARQIEAFAREGDLLIAFSTSGESENAIRAGIAARNRGAQLLAITGERWSHLAGIADVTVQVPSDDTPTIQEIHNMLTHILCDVAESFLTGEGGGAPA